MMRKYLTEFIGTFFLVLTIGLVSQSKPEEKSSGPLVIGCSLMVMVYMGGHISGAHYNPAVSLAVFLRGKLSGKELGPYMLAQFLGAFAASFEVWVITGKFFAPLPTERSPFTDQLPTTGVILSIEVLFTFALALIVLNVATALGTAENSFYGLAIGFTVMVGVYVGGPVSGGAFNPAVGLGPIFMESLNEVIFGDGYLPLSFFKLWYYLVGPFLGGILAAAFFRFQNPDDYD